MGRLHSTIAMLLLIFVRAHFYTIHKNDVNNAMIKRKTLGRSCNSNGSGLDDKCLAHLSCSK